MKKWGGVITISFNTAALLGLFFIHSTHARALSTNADAENELPFSYIAGSPTGPEKWGDLREEWAKCKTGSTQSPIHLSSEEARKRDPTLGSLQTSYRSSDATIRNDGHAIMVRWEGDAGSVNIGGTEYKLKQCHWHSPTEHSIDGRRFNLEFHMVHQSADNRTAVIGILYEIGPPNTFLAEMSEPIRSIANAYEMEKPLGIVDPNMIDIGSGNEEYYKYLGSLTTPPCTEGVTWTIIRQVSSISAEQLTLLTTAVEKDAQKNARPIQQLNGREIYLYTPPQVIN